MECFATLADPIKETKVFRNSKIDSMSSAESQDRTHGSVFVMTAPLLISIVDDDESVRESLPDLLRQFGFPLTCSR